MQTTATARPAPTTTEDGVVDAFIDEVVADYGRRLTLLSDCGDRRAMEDAIALLTDYRLTGMDAASFERFLAALRAGRSPVGLAVLKPETVAADLERRWRARLATRD